MTVNYSKIKLRLLENYLLILMNLIQIKKIQWMEFANHGYKSQFYNHFKSYVNPIWKTQKKSMMF